MSTIKKFEDFICWKEARHLNLIIRKLIQTKKFENDYRLINQILGSAGSIMDNIAEGFERCGNREFVQFLYYAKGSCAELRSQAYRALDAEYLNSEEFIQINEKCKSISYMIHKLIEYIKLSKIDGYKFKKNTSTDSNQTFQTS